MLCLNVECQLQSKHHRLQDGKEKGNKEQTQGAALQENFWKSNTLWHEAGTHSSGHFPGALRVLQTCIKGAKKIPTKWCHRLQFCRQRKLFYRVESMLLCRPLWTVVAFIWEIAGSIILSSTMVLVFCLTNAAAAGDFFVMAARVFSLKSPKSRGSWGHWLGFLGFLLLWRHEMGMEEDRELKRKISSASVEK